MAIKGYDLKTIHSFLTEKPYYIPDYQREYSWDKEDQIEDFWSDLKKIDIKLLRKHFFGQIVVHEDQENGKSYIIDGQQRICTVTILLAAIRDKFALYEEESDEAKIAKEDIRYLYIGRWSSKSDTLKLQLGIADREYFRENIQKSCPNSPPKTISQRRIREAYESFSIKLSEELESVDNVDDKVEILLGYYKILIHSFQIMVITTDDVNEAFIVFETLNARGKDLETSDLLKNNIFMKAGSNIDIVKDKWVTMNETLEKKEDATKLIRYYWNSGHNFTREKDLYKCVSVAITSNNCLDFVIDLCNMAELYNALQLPEDNKYYQDADINEILINISIMKATSFFPIIMAMELNKYDENDIKRVLKAIEVLAFRNFVVSGLTANKYEVGFAHLAQKISDDKLSCNQIVKAITNETIDDEKFRRDLIGFEVKTVKIAKFILREIEDFGGGEKKTNKNNKTINLEHIMPKNNKQWKVDEDFHKDYLYRLGNQTLLLEEFNKSISNKPFSEKKNMYYKSKIEMTKKLCDYDAWDEKSINEREESLNAVIMKIWALQS